jgi:hypothetical protein
MTDVRNEHPLHSHTSPGEIRIKWTQDTMLAHLRHLHGVDQIPDDAPLAELIRKHDELNHGTPARTYQDDPIYQAALAPERRYKSIALGAPRMGYPGDVALYFEDLNGNGTNIVNLRPGDMPVLRAAVTRPDEKGQLAGLRNEWTARLGPGGARAVDAAHVAGYALGVQDMQAALRDYEANPVTPGEVASFLEGLNGSVLPSPLHRAITEVLGLLRDREAV